MLLYAIALHVQWKCDVGVAYTIVGRSDVTLCWLWHLLSGESNSNHFHLVSSHLVVLHQLQHVFSFCCDVTSLIDVKAYSLSCSQSSYRTPTRSMSSLWMNLPNKQWLGADRWNNHSRTHANHRVDLVVTQEKLAGDEIAPGILWVFRRCT